MNDRIGMMAMFLLLVLISCRPTAPKGHIFETELGSVPDPVNITVTPDSRHTIFAMSDGKNQHVVFDGVAGPGFEGVYVERTFVLSQDGKRAGYIIATNKPVANGCKTCGPPGKWRAVIDNHFGPEYEKILGIVFSRDAKQVAYAAMKKNKDGGSFWTLVVNGNERGHYNAISKLSPLFRPDGQQVVMVARKENQKSVVVVNGAESREYDYIGYGIPFFSPDGEHMAYAARDFATNHSTVVFDGTAGPDYNAIPERSLIFSFDSHHFAYGAQTANYWQVIADSHPQDKYQQVDNIQFSPNGQHLTYKAQKGQKWMIVIDGKDGVYQDSIMNGFPVFSADGKNIAYGYKNNGKWKVAVEQTDTRKNVNKQYLINDPIKGYDEIISCFFSPDSKHLSYVVKDGYRMKVVCDGKLGQEYKDIMPHLIYSPDSKHLAYLASFGDADNKKKIVVLDGRPGPECDGVLNENLSFIIFTNDNKHAAYAASVYGKWHLFIDGEMITGAYEMICNLVTSSNGGFESIAVNNKKLYRVKWDFDR